MLFQPPASSIFNCQETVWALLKREYLTRLHRRERDLASSEEFRAMIRRLYEEVPFDVDRILRANFKDVASYFDLGVGREASNNN